MTDGKKMILVIEDEPDQSTYLTALLQDHGYLTESARNGNEAMAKIKASKPDLITLDMSMPEKSGVKFYREIKEDPELSEIPMLVVTGVTGFGGRAEDFQKFLSTRKQVPPPQGFVPKPIDQDQLLGLIKKLLA